MKDNAANLLTLVRAFGIFPLVFCIPYANPTGCGIALAGYLFLILTDFLDGEVARRWGQVCDLGKDLDPVADRLMLMIFLPLLRQGYVSEQLVALLWGREVLIFFLRKLAAHAGFSIAARRSGKWRTALVYAFASLLLLGGALQLPPAPSWFTAPAAGANAFAYAYDQIVILLAWVVALGTVATLLDYYLAHSSLLRRIWRNPRAPFSSLLQA